MGQWENMKGGGLTPASGMAWTVSKISTVICAALALVLDKNSSKMSLCPVIWITAAIFFAVVIVLISTTFTCFDTAVEVTESIAVICAAVAS